MLFRKRSSKCFDTCDRRVLAFAFALNPFRALGRFNEGSNRDVYAAISSAEGCAGSIFKTSDAISMIQKGWSTYRLPFFIMIPAVQAIRSLPSNGSLGDV